MPRSRSRSTSTSISDRESGNDRSNKYRIHVADLPHGIEEHEIRQSFQRFGTLVDLWLASASSFAFVVYKQKEEAQKAIDSMDGRSLGDSRLKVTWARPRTHNRSQRFDSNMRCYKCGQQGHFSRECERLAAESRSTRRRDDDNGRYSSSRSRRYSRSRSPQSSRSLPAPTYFHQGMPMYPTFPRRNKEHYPMTERSNGHEHRHRDRGTRLSPPSTSSRHHRR